MNGLSAKAASGLKAVGRFLISTNFLAALAIVTLFVVVFVAVKSTQGLATASQAKQASDRRDCVTTLSTARRSVFDDVDIYKAILIQAAADRQLDLPLQGDPDYFKSVDTKLSATLKEARRLQPSATLDELIAHGGIIAGKHYDACPT